MSKNSAEGIEKAPSRGQGQADVAITSSAGTAAATGQPLFPDHGAAHTQRRMKISPGLSQSSPCDEMKTLYAENQVNSWLVGWLVFKDRLCYGKQCIFQSRD